MRTWVETASEHFVARHDDVDAEGAADVLGRLEATRDRLGRAFSALPEDDVVVVLHPSDGALALGRPAVPLRRALTAPASRRYVAGGLEGSTIHVLAQRVLLERASAVPGSAEMLLLAPSALYARVVIGASNPRLPPPARVGTLVRAWRWGWLVAGGAAWFSGQTAHARPAIARRLREGGPPAFPPAPRDAELLGGTVVDLLVREEGEAAAVRLLERLHPGGPRGALVAAFGGRRIDHTERAWRAHLARVAEAGPGPA